MEGTDVSVIASVACVSSVGMLKCKSGMGVSSVLLIPMTSLTPPFGRFFKDENIEGRTRPPSGVERKVGCVGPRQVFYAKPCARVRRPKYFPSRSGEVFYYFFYPDYEVEVSWQKRLKRTRQAPAGIERRSRAR